MSEEFIKATHREEDHITDSVIPNIRAKQVLARHLCGWITGHSAPIEHFLIDADIIMMEMHEVGIRVHLQGSTSNAMDGYYGWADS